MSCPKIRGQNHLWTKPNSDFLILKIERIYFKWILRGENRRTMVFEKSTVRPCPSVKRPSSRTCIWFLQKDIIYPSSQQHQIEKSDWGEHQNGNIFGIPVEECSAHFGEPFRPHPTKPLSKAFAALLQWAVPLPGMSIRFSSRHPRRLILKMELKEKSSHLTTPEG